MHTIRFLTFLILVLSASLIVFLIFTPSPSVHILWDWANAIGYIGSGFILMLFIYTGPRRRYQQYASKFYNALHQHLGIIAFVLILLHIGILLLHDPVLIEHLKLTAPYYMLSGLLASVLLAILTISSLQSIRRKIWSKRTSFRSLHAIGGIGVLLLAGIHIINSQYYANTSLKIMVLIAISVLIFSVYLLNKFKRYNFNEPPKQLNSTAPIIISYTSFLILLCVTLVYAYSHNSG
jgi:DMSO/TMAO reductase YedYZ heme-binding membrane subunit